MLGRVTASMRFFTYGVVPPAAVAAGALGGWLGIRTALVAVAVVGMGAPLVLVPTGLFRLRELPR